MTARSKKQLGAVVVSLVLAAVILYLVIALVADGDGLPEHRPLIDH